MQPRKHAAIIKQWADGADIEYRKCPGEPWKESVAPAFVEDYEYRVKPAREYVQTSLTAKELAKAYSESRDGWEEGYIAVANAAIRHAIDHGQVVTREEFDRAIGDRATYGLTVAYAVTAEYRIRGITVGIDHEAVVAKVRP